MNVASQSFFEVGGESIARRLFDKNFAMLQYSSV